MKCFPYESFYITTSLTPAEVHECLQKEIGARLGVSFKQIFRGVSEHYFKGYAWRENFKLEPQVNYRNSFIPQVTGKIEPWLNGSRIHVAMALDSGVFAFMAMWLGFASVAGVAVLFQAIGGDELGYIVLIPLGMIAFAYSLALFGFKNESPDVRNKLVQMFNGLVEDIK